MRLRANFRGIAERLTHEDEVNLLCRLINGGHRHYLETQLREMNIPGRTKIYKSFGWSYGLYDQSTEDRVNNQMRSTEEILRHSSIIDWVEQYCREYTLGSFLDIATSADIDLNGINVRIEGLRGE